ncbi:alkaline phosphatase [uncultured Ferrimonas sp.]|uniref:alkaline phosphatase n=1 Tax=uncultured Ferrimonas sp. TaxID=432640 RepID=UPI002620C87B|nr:alkaline phosphatase [uncultured Ferrimonas sp.]
MKSTLTLALLPLLLAPLVHAQPQAEVKNVIYMVGDGMGPAYLTAYRYYLAGAPGSKVTPTVFDQLLVGSASTYPDDDTWVTDSAAAATALAAGVKSFNGAIGVDADKKSLPSLLVAAKQAGKTTGVVSTSQINHATPASFVAHHESRRAYQPIAEQMGSALKAKEIDLMFGGGQSFFDAAAIDALSDSGASIATDWQQLGQLQQLPAVALLADVALPFAIDAKRNDRLALMTTKALALAEQDRDGFSVLIEGSLIDWCGHSNDIACAMAEMDDFANAITVAKEYVDQHPNTLLVVTADHSTGGLTLGAAGEYQWLPMEIRKVHASADVIAKAFVAAKRNQETYQQVWRSMVDFDLTEQQLHALLAFADDAHWPRVSYIGNIVATRSYTGWTTGGHTAVDVPVMAYGAGAEQFIGMQDNTDLPKKIMQLLQID